MMKPGLCITCSRTESSRWFKANTTCASCSRNLYRNVEKDAEYDRKYRLEHKEQERESNRLYKLNNMEKLKAWKKAYNHGPEKRKSKENINRKKHIRKATPKWVNKKEIMDIYLKTPKGMQVDHIIPLRGKEVSGLHVPWNLQYLSAEENNKKQNYLVV